MLAISDDPASTRAWARGAIGERKLAQALAGVPGIRVLHDRQVPGTRGNIDHLIVSEAGIFVVDAKLYQGEIRVRDVGGLFKSDHRLYVGMRDCSHLATNMGWQVDAVLRALHAAGLDPTPPVTPVLCFVDGEWPLLFPAEEYHGVRLEGKRSIKKLLTRGQLLASDSVDGIYRRLAAAFPAK